MASTTDKGKKYTPLTPTEAFDMCARIIGKNFADDMSMVEAMLYAETLMLHRRIDEIENQAQEMMSPDAMMEMAGKFLGGGMPGMG